MKTRLLAMPAIISALSMLAACGSGGGNSLVSGAFQPTVTITATPPENKKVIVVGSEFTITWSSTGSNSCTADFDSGTGTSSTVSVTATAVGSKTYSVTCTGDGGSATNSTTVQVVDVALPQGIWQGATKDGRGLYGVITREGGYWLTYTRSASDSTVVGFYTGTAVAVQGDFPTGTFSSPNLREVNFDTGFPGGNTAAGTIASGSYSAKESTAGSLNPVPTSPSGNWIINNVTESGSSTVHTQTSSGTATLDITSGVLTINTVGNFHDSVGLGVNDSLNITEIYNGTVSGTTWTASGTGTYQFSNCQIVSGPNFCGLIPTGQMNMNSVTGTLTRSIDETTQTITGAVTMTVAGGPVPVSVTDTLTIPGLSSLPSIAAAGSFTLDTYNPVYEETPSLAAVAGSYTTGSTGVGQTMQADASLTIASDGSINGTESVSQCSYTATIAPHATGNVYDVTALTFAGGACVYTSSTAFTGVAIYDATTKKLTLTALDANRNKGFMVIATKP